MTATVVVVATAALSQSVAAVSLLVYFAGVVFALVVAAAAGRAVVCVLRARESAEWFGNLSTNCERGDCLYALKFAMWKKLSARVCVCVWVQVADSTIYEGLTGQMSTTEISATTAIVTLSHKLS